MQDFIIFTDYRSKGGESRDLIRGPRTSCCIGFQKSETKVGLKTKKSKNIFFALFVQIKSIQCSNNSENDLPGTLKHVKQVNRTQYKLNESLQPSKQSKENLTLPLNHQYVNTGKQN